MIFLASDTHDEVRTERLRLRSPVRSDVDPLDSAVAETLDDLARWLPWAKRGHSRADSRHYVQVARQARARRLAFEFVVEDADTGLFLGMTSLHRIDWNRRSAGLGYWIRKSAWGRGFATEAAHATLDTGFRGLGLHRIEAHVAVANHASHRVVEKLGFEREGLARGFEFVDGQYLDHVQYGLLQGDFGRAP